MGVNVLPPYDLGSGEKPPACPHCTRSADVGDIRLILVESSVTHWRYLLCEACSCLWSLDGGEWRLSDVCLERFDTPAAPPEIAGLLALLDRLHREVGR